MKIAISSWGYRKWFTEKRCDLVSFLDEVQRQGAEGFEIFPQHVDKTDPAGHLAAVMDKAKRLGLDVSTLIAGNDFALPKVKDRAAQVETMLTWIRLAASVGITRLNVFTGYHRPGEDPAMERCRVVDSFREVIPEAEGREITLCLENHSSVHPDADGLLWIIRAVGSVRLRTNPDPTNFCAHYADVPEGARDVIYTETQKIAPLMANAHMKIRDFTPEGSHKQVNVKRLLDIYRSTGYDGHVVLEYHGQDDPQEPNKLGVALLRHLLA